MGIRYLRLQIARSGKGSDLVSSGAIVVGMLSDTEIKEICRAIESRFEELARAEAEADEQAPDLLYHYTSAEGLLGIVRSREIWSTSVLYLNDASELSHATEVLTAELGTTPLKLRPNAGTFSMSIPVYSKDLTLDHFVSSFCEDKDLLSQWRGYGSGAGYSVGFPSAVLHWMATRGENNDRGACTLRKVTYRLDQQKRMIRARIAALNEILEQKADELEPTYDDEFRRLILLWNQIAASFHPILALMKHVAFEGEKEWRLVRTLWKPSVPTVSWPVQFRMIGGRLAPYLPIKWVLPNTPPSPEVRGLKEVWCGPSATPELTEKVARDLLIAEHCWNVRVLRSQVPLRA
jgi:Protein of unknown function (DUF2971)